MTSSALSQEALSVASDAQYPVSADGNKRAKRDPTIPLKTLVEGSGAWAKLEPAKLVPISAPLSSDDDHFTLARFAHALQKNHHNCPSCFRTESGSSNIVGLGADCCTQQDLRSLYLHDWSLPQYCPGSFTFVSLMELLSIEFFCFFNIELLSPSRGFHIPRFFAGDLLQRLPA